MNIPNDYLPFFIAIISYFFLFVAVLFTIYMNRRRKQIIKVAKYIANSGINKTVFANHVIPTLLNMHNPFTFLKPTIENYFSENFIEKYLNNN